MASDVRRYAHCCILVVRSVLPGTTHALTGGIRSSGICDLSGSGSGQHPPVILASFPCLPVPDACIMPRCHRARRKPPPAGTVRVGVHVIRCNAMSLAVAGSSERAPGRVAGVGACVPCHRHALRGRRPNVGLCMRDRDGLAYTTLRLVGRSRRRRRLTGSTQPINATTERSSGSPSRSYTVLMNDECSAGPSLLRSERIVGSPASRI